LFIFKHEVLIISLNLKTAFTAQTHLAEGQWLEEQLNMVKLRVSCRNTIVACFEETEAIFSAIINIYIIILLLLLLLMMMVMMMMMMMMIIIIIIIIIIELSRLRPVASSIRE
jgi:hypothetical protein